jgi:lipooligosaccharide transport system ATP-binding protein
VPSTPSTAGSRSEQQAGAAPLVVARQLVKRFGDFLAVDGVDFVGPNGAGKTSTMRMIACMSPLTSGTLRVLGMDPATDGPKIRSRIGLVAQEDTLDLELTVLDNLMIYGRYFDLPKKVIRERAERLLDFAQLTERAHDKVDPLSGGMKRRLTIPHLGTRPPHLGRADHRPRPPGPPPALGPAVPAPAGRGHARHHHPLHGRGRAAL